MLIDDILREYDVILASASPRRRELMEYICEKFRVIPADCDETLPEGIAVTEAASYLANKKCECIAQVYTNALVIGCDTVVICQGNILGKPADEQQARQMLRMLSGKTHEVITGVTVMCAQKKMSFSQTTKVKFRELRDEVIEAYIRSGEPMDKAGAYGIQGYGALLVEEIKGDFFNVMGLPVSELTERLHQFLKN